ncbi:hypothetical protein PARPLA_02518 [Rhodobacteraceae bacterium THAF1]|uniref:hypothetical protein n=1 Tax=Palleronia sp. THAF1 TaxID=2587842 RepID=UPI000F3E7CCB|nr:hypothetical protein [Palleronia sp. THAF1]QFU07998.1 hypothetical protein FIU81_04865 [Palleronia sp. THAF1]VDC27849.1 hypothetical protein PARPLA_02518 [Rhodobacteraceae bacterium THAF1]
MSDNDDATSGPGSTDDPNQATRTGLPEKEPVTPKRKPDHSDPDDPNTGPGSTSDPNQANRT